ncbi:hypothetical protein ACJA25_03675 [Mycoplasmopsis hyopharyngis]|uniref:hypothetical protein n=1 Tax=Mycoplasmopsis hyopharyngis TaxID=29558 RepID=UPI0038732743
MIELKKITKNDEILFDIATKEFLKIKILNFDKTKFLLYHPLNRSFTKIWFILKDANTATIINGLKNEKDLEGVEQFSTLPVYKDTFIEINLNNVYGIKNHNFEEVKILEVTNENIRINNKATFVNEMEMKKLKEAYYDKGSWPFSSYPQYAENMVSQFKTKDFFIYVFRNWKVTPKKDCYVVDLETLSAYKVDTGEQITFKEYLLVYKRTINIETEQEKEDE